ncbi:HET-domain-containing protein [Phaeosphaeriaceae sp. SRC1lsM3a]|nr:HET-domain-containing protein [Stagonospora sp. SRC1lsM3a]
MLRRFLRPRNEHHGDDGCPTCRAYLNSQCMDADGMLRSYEQASFRCNFCALLLRTLRPFVVATKARASDAAYILHESPDGHLTFEINWTANGRKEFFRIHITTDQGSACPFQNIKSGPIGIRHPKLAAACINDWLRTCEDNHPDCRQDTGGQRLPTRVLQILGPERVRLYVPKPAEVGQWACLSHCWGGIQSMLCTTKATQKLHQDNIAWHDLPPTFQDAIEVTRHLGIKYLWIDSLCIIQDDAEDWRHEGSKMASIYAGCYVTLAASASHHSGESLCHALLDEKFEMHRHSDDMPYDIYYRKVPDHTRYLANTMPLMKRAWAFQERTLSNRIAHFGETELYWECRAKRYCECGHLSQLRQHIDPLRKMLANTSQKKNNAEGLNIVTWKDIVVSYTRLQLTYASDIFPALQGIANRWHGNEPGDYLAGLWRGDLMRDLLWRSRLSGNRPNAYRAPTWSWASVVGWIDWWPDVPGLKHDLATLLSATTIPKGEDPCGEVVAGSIVLKGRCVSAKLVYEGVHESYRPGNCVEIALPEEHDVLKIGTGEWVPDVSTNVGADSKILLMSIYKVERQTFDRVDSIVYLLAFRQKAGDDELYERVGCAGIGSVDVHAAFKQVEREMVVTVV